MTNDAQNNVTNDACKCGGCACQPCTCGEKACGCQPACKCGCQGE